MKDLKNQVRDRLSWGKSIWSLRVDINLMAHNQSNLNFPDFNEVTLTRFEATLLLIYDAKNP